MDLNQNVFPKPNFGSAVLAGALSLIIAGCSSKPPSPSQPPPAAVAPVPAPAPVVTLTPSQLVALRQIAPGAAGRIQAGQPLTLDDVKAMTRAGFTSDVIIAQVRNSRTVFHLTSNSIIDLKNAGVTDSVIDFLLNTPSAIAGSEPVPEPSATPAAVQTAPPPPPEETPPPSPGVDYVWVGGDWVWNGGWVWVGGHWAIPPYPHAVWLHGRWWRGPAGYHRDRGHWGW